MSNLKNCSEIKILQNSLSQGSNLLLRKAVVNEITLNVGVKIFEGKVLDNDNDNATLPCPPYCGEDGEVIQIGNGVNFFTNENPNTSGYLPADVDEVQAQAGAAGLLEILIKYDVVTQNALIALNTQGRVMDDDNHKVALKS